MGKTPEAPLLRFTRHGHCQNFKRDGTPCTSETGLGIVTTYNEGDGHVWRRWFCASHRYDKHDTYQGRVRYAGESTDFHHCFAWHEGYGPEEAP